MATQISNISAKYKDIVSKCSLIHSGSPAVYQLKTKTEKIGTLTKITVGKKNINKISKTILLVGETGTGKSTLINALVNYTMGVKFEDDIWFEIVEGTERSQTESQTLDVIVYEIFDFEAQTLPYSLTIIDTPGFGDTRGIKHDLIISQRLFGLFHSEDRVHEMNAVGLVMKVTDNRLRYIFDSVTSLFGKDLEKNIVALITHSNGTTPENLLQSFKDTNIKCAKTEENKPVHFMFDNCQNTERKSKNIEALESAWNITMEQIGEFTYFLEKCGPQKLKTTVEVLQSHIRLTACINNLQERIKVTELKQREIQQIQEAVKKHEEEMKMKEEFAVEVDEVYKDKEPINGGMWLVFCEGAVCCNVCEENCHYPGCSVTWSPVHCEVMKGGYCTICTKKCPASDHVKENWRFVTKNRKVKKTTEEMMKKYEKNESESKRKLSILENLEKEMQDLTVEKNQLLEESYKHVVRLEQIALHINSVHLDFLIEKGDKEKLRNLRDIKHQWDKTAEV